MKSNSGSRIGRGGFCVRRLAAGFVFCLLLFPKVSDAQAIDQLWFEYSPSYSFASEYKLGMRGSYRTNLEDPRWRSIEVRLMPEKKLNSHFDLLGSLQFLDTKQYKELTSLEIRPTVGVRWHFLPGKRIASGAMARIEFRNVYKNEAEVWTRTVRPRLRLFASMPLNEQSMSPDRVFYATSFVEFFFQNDDDIQERFSNRLWIRLGLGYKLNKKLKFELLYNRQDSKNTYGDNFEDLTKENIILFAVRHKLN